MISIRKSAVFALALLVPSAVFAAPIQSGDYQALDYNGIRSIWTPRGDNNPSSNAFVQGNGASALWSFDSASRFSYDGSSASLSGRATNTGQSNLAFDFNLEFGIKTTGNTPYCQQAGAGSAHNCATTTAGIDPSDWTFFSITSAMFTGVAGSHLEGLSYSIVSNPMHAPQAGDAANALEETGLGFSMWFNWTKNGSATSPFASAYTFNDAGRGDINIDLKPEPSVVPLPAAIWLLLSGLGGLGALRRWGSRPA